MTKEELANIKKLVTFCKKNNVKVFTDGNINFAFHDEPPVDAISTDEINSGITHEQIMFAHTEGLRRKNVDAQ